MLPPQKELAAMTKMSTDDLNEYVKRQSLFYGRDGICISTFMLQDELAAGGFKVPRGRITRSLRMLVREGVLVQVTPYHFGTPEVTTR